MADPAPISAALRADAWYPPVTFGYALAVTEQRPCVTDTAGISRWLPMSYQPRVPWRSQAPAKSPGPSFLYPDHPRPGHDEDAAGDR